MKWIADYTIRRSDSSIRRGQNQPASGFENSCELSKHLCIAGGMFNGFKRHNYIKIIIVEIKPGSVQHAKFNIRPLPLLFAFFNSFGCNISSYYTAIGMCRKDIGSKASATGYIQYNISIC